jgi:hypothetical protein
MIFSPLAPVGIALTAGSAVAGLATAAGDTISSKVKGRWLLNQVAHEESLSADLNSIQESIMQIAR